MTSPSNIKNLVEFRRILHQHPELGYQEFVTTKLIVQKLEELGVNYQIAIGNTGVTAEIAKGDGKCVVLRADIDALPVSEQTDLEFASKNVGVMHACGHDLHATMLIGALEELQKRDFQGKIKFIFQPSEEGVNGDPEKKSGGQRIVESGVLKDVDYCLALHVHPLFEVGNLFYTRGNAFANSSFFTINVQGISGHAGAAPHLTVDAILVSSVLIQNLHTIVSRNINPNKTGVVSVTMINGGEAPNVIADKVELRGTVRALDTSEYEIILNRIKQVVKGVSELFNTSIELSIDSYYPALVNAHEVHLLLGKVIQKVFGKKEVECEPSLAGEDFSFYAQKTPSIFYFLGAKDKSNEGYFLHHPKVVFNEDCIKYGVNFFTEAAIELLY